jgi:DnaJ-class molecular chaperone
LAADPYVTLGVPRDASQDAIRKAYRGLAKQLHPDLNPGDKEAEERFKAVTAAYDLLGDEEKRARFDRGEIDESGAERPQRRYYRDFAEDGAHPYASDAGYSDFAGEDIFADLFGRRRGGEGFRARGSDARYGLELDFLDAVNGAARTITLPDGSTLSVTIPPGTRDGQVLRLKGKGRPGIGGGPPGDALIEITVRPHDLFRREGDDIHVVVPISLRDAVLGGKVEVPTTTGRVSVTVPPWSNTDRVLRLKGKGVARSDGGRGDELVRLKLVLPEKPDPALERFVAGWHPGGEAGQAQYSEA